VTDGVFAIGEDRQVHSGAWRKSASGVSSFRVYRNGVTPEQYM